MHVSPAVLTSGAVPASFFVLVRRGLAGLHLRLGFLRRRKVGVILGKRLRVWGFGGPFKCFGFCRHYGLQCEPEVPHGAYLNR